VKKTIRQNIVNILSEYHEPDFKTKHWINIEYNKYERGRWLNNYLPLFVTLSTTYYVVDADSKSLSFVSSMW
jgi:hypothetical protein